MNDGGKVYDDLFLNIHVATSRLFTVVFDRPFAASFRLLWHLHQRIWRRIGQCRRILLVTSHFVDTLLRCTLSSMSRQCYEEGRKEN